eukprot:Rhum_TRINITY_DN13999_c0_g1::Rhum_TRINITY_DN13999_c0_g1_i1::g.66777::m.66777
MFAVNAAAEIAGTKHNYELSFPAQPTVPQLVAEAESVFGRVCPPGHPLHISAVQIFDDVAQGWAGLLTDHQIRHGCQVYCLSADDDAAADGDAAALAAAAATAGAAAAETYLASSAAAAAAAASPLPVASPQTLLVFEQLARTHLHALGPGDFVYGLQGLRLDFPETCLREIFDAADADADGLLSLPEFASLAEAYPALLESAHARCVDVANRGAVEEESARVRQSLSCLEEQGKSTRDLLREVEQAELDRHAKLRGQEGCVTLAKQRDREAAAKLVAASGASEAAAHALEERRRALAQAKEQSRAKDAQLAHACGEAEKVMATVRAAGADVDRVAQTIAALESELRTQHEALQRCEEAAKVASGYYAASETRMRLAEEEAARARAAQAEEALQRRRLRAVDEEAAQRKAAVAREESEGLRRARAAVHEGEVRFRDDMRRQQRAHQEALAAMRAAAEREEAEMLAKLELVRQLKREGRPIPQHLLKPLRPHSPATDACPDLPHISPGTASAVVSPQSVASPLAGGGGDGAREHKPASRRSRSSKSARRQSTSRSRTASKRKP